MTEDVDYGEILEALNEKADRDLQNVTTNINNTFAKVDGSNLSDAGKSLIAGLGMPSTRYEDLTLGASGAEYTAPAKGWVFLKQTASNANRVVSLFNETTSIQISTKSDSGTNDVYIPVLAGDTFMAFYVGDCSIFRFIYAEGEENV